ncbi:hypothetical protein [Epilithonimonas sp.]|uniref:hypothetical protein n=1 Tax=Epilithonimonas sp. TaxID=2894511 RepID=UPI002FDE377F
MKKNNNPPMEELLTAIVVYQQETIQMLQAILLAITPPEVLVRKDSAETKKELNVSDSTLYRWRIQGYIKFEKIKGKIYYFINTLRKKDK